MKKKIINFNDSRDVIVEYEPQSRTIKYRSKNDKLDIINLELPYLQFVQTERATRVVDSNKRLLCISFSVYCSKESLFDNFDINQDQIELYALDLPNIISTGEICQKKEELGTTIEENILNFWSSEFNSDIRINISLSYFHEFNKHFPTDDKKQIDSDIIEFLKKTNYKNKSVYNKVYFSYKKRKMYAELEEKTPDPFIQEYFDLTLEERKEKYTGCGYAGITTIYPKMN